MYVDLAQLDATTLYQGDIIRDVPFFLLENSLGLRKNRNGQYSRISDRDESELRAIETKTCNIMILSQTCDVQRRTNIIVCPVYNLDVFIADNTITVDSARNIRERKLYYWFYLPAFAGLSESIADFQTMIYIPRAGVEDFTSRRIAALSDLGRHHLGWALAIYFGRPVNN